MTEQPAMSNGMASRARPEILAMKGYASARSLVESGGSTVFLDANECPYEPFVGASGLARYPMQQPPELLSVICDWLDLSSRNVTVMRGADEAIDSLMRAFCVPSVDNIIVCPPTFAMYRQSAILQGVEVREAPLAKGFALDTEAVLSAVDDNTKLVFVCSPNNPTANLMDRNAVEELCVSLVGRALVVVDETYIEYAGVDSMAEALERFENLVVLRTLSKSHAACALSDSAACCAGRACDHGTRQSAKPRRKAPRDRGAARCVRRCRRSNRYCDLGVAVGRQLSADDCR